jgi:hypothetical protein
MGLFWRNNDMSYQQSLATIRDAVAQVIVPLQTQISDMRTVQSEQNRKLDILTGDHVRREDMDQLRKEMRDGFGTMEQKTYSREMVDAMRAETNSRMDGLEKTIEEHRSSIVSQSERVWTRIGIASSVVFGVASILISFLAR